jgi:hypothetical protein
MLRVTESEPSLQSEWPADDNQPPSNYRPDSQDKFKSGLRESLRDVKTNGRTRDAYRTGSHRSDNVATTQDQPQRAFEKGELHLTSIHFHQGLFTPISECLLKAWAFETTPQKVHYSLKDLAIKLSSLSRSKDFGIHQNISQPMWYLVSFKPQYITLFLHKDLVVPFSDAVRTSLNGAAVCLAETLLSEPKFETFDR